ncbi:MAG TPA: sugar phosphate isomerase/epimerase [Gemmatimonadales bacterium]|jgi:sugar phosphate isomerase/epimerase|nr:sugar phosphate isomerase/epimerase [Gemmatimonadales bacterium]
MNFDRRRFLGAAGAGALALALPPPLLELTGARIGRIGLQLYTVRSLLAKDFEGTLEQVAKIGYKEVEFAGYFDRTPAQVRKLLDHLGLRAPSAHIPLESLQTDWARTLDAAEALGHEYLVVAWLDQRDRNSLAALGRTMDTFNKAGDEAWDRRIRFAYHNHDFEFTPVDGRLPYDVLLAGTDPRYVNFEMDLYWITKGGQDPLAYFQKYPGRFPMVHVKDMAAGQAMVDVGKGRIDWARIFAKRKEAGIRHYFVEHDEPPDPIASITASYRYLKGLRF